MQIRWEEKRHVEDNIGRITGSKSKRVEWTTAEQFWLPRLDVKGILELVMMLPTQTLEGWLDNYRQLNHVISGRVFLPNKSSQNPREDET